MARPSRAGAILLSLTASRFCQLAVSAGGVVALRPQRLGSTPGLACISWIIRTGNCDWGNRFNGHFTSRMCFGESGVRCGSLPNPPWAKSGGKKSDFAGRHVPTERHDDACAANTALQIHCQNPGAFIRAPASPNRRSCRAAVPPPCRQGRRVSRTSAGQSLRCRGWPASLHIRPWSRSA